MFSDRVPGVRRSALARLLPAAAVAVVAGLAASPGAGTATAATPKVACWDMTGETRVAARRKPRECGLSPRSTAGNYLIGARWSRWTRRGARGRGASFRLWGDVAVRLFAPRRVCGGRFFTRARVHYVGGGAAWPDRTYRLRSC